MDIEANLIEQRRLAAEIIALHDSNESNGGNAPEVYRAAGRLAELVQAMDEWLSDGGMFPLAWLPPEAHLGGTAGSK